MAVFSFFAQFANISAFAVVFWFDFEHYGKVKVSSRYALAVGILWQSVCFGSWYALAVAMHWQSVCIGGRYALAVGMHWQFG